MFQGPERTLVKDELGIFCRDGLNEKLSLQLEQPDVALKFAQQLHSDLVQIGAPPGIIDLVNVSNDPADLPKVIEALMHFFTTYDIKHKYNTLCWELCEFYVLARRCKFSTRVINNARNPAIARAGPEADSAEATAAYIREIRVAAAQGAAGRAERSAAACEAHKQLLQQDRIGSMYDQYISPGVGGEAMPGTDMTWPLVATQYWIERFGKFWNEQTVLRNGTSASSPRPNAWNAPLNTTDAPVVAASASAGLAPKKLRDDDEIRRLKALIGTQKKEISGLNSKLHRLKQLTSDSATAGQGDDITELVTTLQTLTTTLNKVAPSLLALTQTRSTQSVLVGAVPDDTTEAQHYETWKANREAQKLATTMAPMLAALVKKEINALVAPSGSGLNPYEQEYYDRMAKVSGLGQ